ncbi:hypothetical protein SDC9_19868 [bioreactor metagenome]|uniref:Uncharacterized protein n=1 Tax=bioreactor metagenome TaxID=1076179 RepID=A0A644U542_9ZZZZ
MHGRGERPGGVPVGVAFAGRGLGLRTCQKGVGENPDSPRAPALPWHALDRPAPMRYLRAQVPGTCRLQTQVTVKPGTRRHLTLEAFRAVGNAGPHPS